MTKITLKMPIQHDGESYSEIDVDEPTVGGVEAFESAKSAGDTDMTATIKMLAAETGWPVEIVRKIKASDMAKISETLAPFVETAGATGG